MSANRGWMPFYVGDYLADTERLTTIEHGAYLLLIMEYWRNGPLPDDDVLLARIARQSTSNWRRNLRTKLAFWFVKFDDGLLHHKRIDAELLRCNRLDRRPKDSRYLTPENQFDTVSSTIPSRAIARQSQRKKEREESNQGSDLNRSDAGASQNPTDARLELWSSGVVILRSLTGLPDAKARGVMGKLCKAAGDDCAAVSRAVTAAVDLRPGDPVAWLMQAVVAKADAFGWIEALANGKGGNA